MHTYSTLYLLRKPPAVFGLLALCLMIGITWSTRHRLSWIFSFIIFSFTRLALILYSVFCRRNDISFCSLLKKGSQLKYLDRSKWWLSFLLLVKISWRGSFGNMNTGCLCDDSLVLLYVLHYCLSEPFNLNLCMLEFFKRFGIDWGMLISSFLMFSFIRLIFLISR